MSKGPLSVRATFFNGVCHLLQNLFKSLYRGGWWTWFLILCSLSLAHDLAKEQKLNFGDDIAGAVRLAKKKVGDLTNL